MSGFTSHFFSIFFFVGVFCFGQRCPASHMLLVGVAICASGQHSNSTRSSFILGCRRPPSLHHQSLDVITPQLNATISCLIWIHLYTSSRYLLLFSLALTVWNTMRTSQKGKKNSIWKVRANLGMCLEIPVPGFEFILCLMYLTAICLPLHHDYYTTMEREHGIIMNFHISLPRASIKKVSVSCGARQTQALRICGSCWYGFPLTQHMGMADTTKICSRLQPKKQAGEKTNMEEGCRNQKGKKLAHSRR